MFSAFSFSLGWLGITALNPLLLAGIVGIASPIIIHLLSKRRFKVVDWAAMDFLLDAERRNRRRIRLEHLLLLALRCLAIMLIALLVARPVREATGLAAAISPAVKTERIVLLDDSPSTQQKVEGQNVFAQAKATLSDFVRSNAADRPDDTMSLLLTSDPAQRVVAGQHFERKREEILRTIDALEPADTAAQLDEALLALEKELEGTEATGSGVLNRVLYIVTDLRQRDWTPAPDTPDDRSVAGIIERLGEKSQGVVIVDIGGPPTENLSVTGIVPREKSIIAGVRSRFEVTVKNNGLGEARDVKVRFTAGDAPPQTGFIDSIPPGKTGAAPFSFTFAEPGSRRIVAEIEADGLPVDDSRLYVARVQEGVKVLIVDGDPSSEYGRTETFFLNRALAPPGDRASGNAIDVVTESQLATTDLGDYQVVMLCNVYQVPEAQRQPLYDWVAAGGGLIVFLGDQIDDELYNRELFDEVPLLPAPLLKTAGDETERTWANPSPLAVTHPVLRIFEGLNNPFINRVKVFRWWALDLSEPLAERAVISVLNDADGSPWLVERAVGSGKSLLMTTSADGDWTSWPADDSYPVTMLATVEYLARRTASDGNLTVGRPLLHTLDVSTYKPEALMIAPGAEESTTLQAGTRDQADPADPADAPAATTASDRDPAAVELAFRYDRTNKAGLYTLQLERFDGLSDELLFAANIDADEGDLTPMSKPALTKLLGDANAQIADGRRLMSDSDEGGRAELWPVVLAFLLAVLGVEQTLAWAFGRRR